MFVQGLMRRMGLTAAAVLAAGLHFSGAAQAVTIDDFTSIDTSWPKSRSSIGSTITTESALVDVLGSVRTSDLQITSIDPPPTFQNETLAIGPTGDPGAPGIMEFTSTSRVNGLVTLTYGDGSPLSIAGAQSIRIDFLSYDQGGLDPLPVTVKLIDGANAASLSLDVNDAGPHTEIFTLASFLNIGSVDLASLDQIQFVFDAPKGGDFAATKLYTFTPPVNIPSIPSPASPAMLAITALVGLRRRGQSA